jgi:hypothetical protein
MYTVFNGKGNAGHQLGVGIFIYKQIRLAVKTVEVRLWLSGVLHHAFPERKVRQKILVP